MTRISFFKSKAQRLDIRRCMSVLISEPVFIHVNQPKKLFLKELTHKDSEDLFKTVDANRTHLREWLPWVDATKKIKDCEDFIEFSLTQRKEGNAFVLGAFQGSQLIGTTSFVSIEPLDKRAELGYWFIKNAQGQGFATMCSLALMSFGFEHLHLDEIVARCVADNARSYQVLKRIGFGLSNITEIQYSHGITSEQAVVKGVINRPSFEAIYELDSEKKLRHTF